MNKKGKKYLLSIVNNNYENIAQEFDESRKKEMKVKVFEIVADLKIKSGDKVLDLGCGNGRFLNVLPQGVSYLGVDNSVNLIKLAKQNYGDFFKILDLNNINSLDNFDFDYIFSWAVLHHIPGNKLRIKFLNDLYKQMQEGSVFVFSVWKLRQKKNFKFKSLKLILLNILSFRFFDYGDLVFYWKGKKALKDKNNLRYYHAFSKNSLLKLVKQSKFNIENIIEDDYNYYLVLRK